VATTEYCVMMWVPQRPERESRSKRERSRRCDPALFSFAEKGTLLAFCVTVPEYRDGKAAKRAGEPEDLPT